MQRQSLSACGHDSEFEWGVGASITNCRSQGITSIGIAAVQNESRGDGEEYFETEIIPLEECEGLAPKVGGMEWWEKVGQTVLEAYISGERFHMWVQE